jgi:hypothetical protein
MKNSEENKKEYRGRSGQNSKSKARWRPHPSCHVQGAGARGGGGANGFHRDAAAGKSTKGASSRPYVEGKACLPPSSFANFPDFWRPSRSFIFYQ